MLFDTLEISRCHNLLFLSIPYISFIIGLFCEFVSCADSLMG